MTGAIVTVSRVRGTAHLETESISDLITMRRRLEQDGVPLMRHRVHRRVLLVPARFTERVVELVLSDGFHVEEQLT